MKQTLRLMSVLGATCLVAAVVLAAGNLVTEVPRQRADARERQRNLRVLVPDFRNNPLTETVTVPVLDGDGKSTAAVTFYACRDAEQNGRLVAFAGEATSGKGYGGNVTVLASLGPDGAIRQSIVTGHSETPGLGTRVTDRVRVRYIWQAFRSVPDAGLPPSPYLDQYDGRRAADIGNAAFHVVKTTAEVTDKTALAVTGATVSSKAVADALNLICAAFVQHREELPAR